MSTSYVWGCYTLGEVHTLYISPSKNPATARASLYKFARTHGLRTRAYIVDHVVDHSLVFVIVPKGDPLPDLPNAPARGYQSHKARGEDG